MSDPEGWLERYGKEHSNLAFPALFWAGLLFVVTATVGLLWALPIPAQFYEISPFLNWGTAFLMAATIYYFIISLSIAIGLLPFLLAVAAFQLWLAGSSMSGGEVSLSLLVAGTLALWLGHRSEPGLWPVLKDLQMMMIGPAWLLSDLYRRLRIPY